MFDPDFSYLLFIDIVKLPERTIHDFEATEVGYTDAMIEGYRTAFAYSLREGLTPEFINKIHASAVQHIPGLHKGQYIEEGNHFLFGYPKKGGISALNPTATPAGLEEFIATWIERKQNPLHFLHFKSDSPDTPEFFFYPVNLYEGTKESIVIKQNLQQRRVDVYPFEEKKANNLKLFHSLVSHGKYNCYVNKLDPQFLLLADNPPTIKQVIQREMQVLCDSYNKEIRDAITNEQKYESS